MGVINPNNTTKFINTKNLFSKIKRDLRSFNSVGIIDEGDMYDYTVEILDSLGLGGLKEDHAILTLKNKQARLPDGFRNLYSAEKCEIDPSSKSHPRLQNSYAFYTDTSYEKVGHPKGVCATGCDIDVERTKITVREYVDGIEDIHNFRNICPLTLVSGIVRPDGDDRRQRNDPNVIQIDNGCVYAHFDGTIYIKYYGLATDPDTNLPLIPDIKSIVKAIEFYIKYNLFLNWYLNDSVPGGVVQKAGELKKLYEESFAQAYSETKIPTFADTIQQIRILRSSKNIYRQIEKY